MIYKIFALKFKLARDSNYWEVEGEEERGKRGGSRRQNVFPRLFSFVFGVGGENQTTGFEF